MTDFNNVEWDKGAKYWDEPWNPMVGCLPASPACENCYARASTDRFGCSFSPHATTKRNPPRKGVVFCGNMTDLFGEWVDGNSIAEWLGKSVGNIGKATYLWLTKRPGRMCAALDGLQAPQNGRASAILSELDGMAMGNHYFGMTAENQQWYDRRKEEFVRAFPKWANGWLSAEPLLGPLDLGFDRKDPATVPFKWIVVGCESGAKRRPCAVEWVRDVVRQAREAGVKVFVKQLSIDGKCERDIRLFPEDLRVRQVPWATEK